MSADIKKTLDQRGGRYGRFTNNALTTEQLIGCLDDHDAWAEMEPYQREALRMICHKMARIICGDPDYDDSWRDIAGYASLVVENLNGVDR